MGVFHQIKQHGLIYSFAIVFNRIVPQWLFRCRRFVIYQLDPQDVANQASSAASANRIRIRWCENEADYESAERLTYFRRCASPGKNQACVAEIAGRPVAGIWAAAKQFDELELGVRIVLDAHQVWLYAAQVDKVYRNRGIYSQVLAFVAPELIAQGYDQLLVAVNPNNLGSNKVHRRYSSYSPGTVLAIRFLTTTVCFTFGDLTTDRTIVWNCRRSPISIRLATVVRAPTAEMAV